MNQLTALFEELNRRYWNGRLPHYHVVYRRLPGNTYGLCDSKRQSIYIRPGHQGEVLRRKLLHEMCHIGCPYHGEKFLARLARLADLGETWALEEIKEYRSTPTFNQDMARIKYSLPELARREPCPTWRELAQWVESDMGGYVIHKIPWLRAAWRNAKRQAKADKESRRRLVARLGGQR